MDSEGDGTRQTTVNVNPLSLRSIIKVQGKTARKLRESPIIPLLGKL
jgi:hypothetical protein